MSIESKDLSNKNKLYQEFRIIIESIVLLVESLSIQFLAILLNISSNTIALRLKSLYFVLRILANLNISIRILHLSFSEFLLNNKLQLAQFRINNLAIYRMLLSKCLQLLFESNSLEKNMCELEHSDKSQREIDQFIINSCLTLAIQYVCQY